MIKHERGERVRCVQAGQGEGEGKGLRQAEGTSSQSERAARE